MITLNKHGDVNGYFEKDDKGYIVVEQSDLVDLFRRLEALESLVGVVTIEDEILFLKENATSASYIARRYNASNSDKNGFSTREIAEYLSVSIRENGKWRRERDLAIDIFTELQE